MKQFFQGLVIGASLVYWCVYYGEDFLSFLVTWLDEVARPYRHGQLYDAQDPLAGLVGGVARGSRSSASETIVS